VSLAAADWLTAWHPQTGLAHLEWPADRPPQGSAYKGLVVVTSPPGFSVAGTVSVYPVWKGTGRVRSLHPDDLLRQSFDGTDRLRFPGLRPGRYALRIAVKLRAKETDEWIAISDVHEFDLPEEHPTVIHRLEPQ
jgi:hypothetical protein